MHKVTVRPKARIDVKTGDSINITIRYINEKTAFSTDCIIVDEESDVFLLLNRPWSLNRLLNSYSVNQAVVSRASPTKHFVCAYQPLFQYE